MTGTGIVMQRRGGHSSSCERQGFVSGVRSSVRKMKGFWVRKTASKAIKEGGRVVSTETETETESKDACVTCQNSGTVVWAKATDGAETIAVSGMICGVNGFQDGKSAQGISP